MISMAPRGGQRTADRHGHHDVPRDIDPGISGCVTIGAHRPDFETEGGLVERHDMKTAIAKAMINPT